MEILIEEWKYLYDYILFDTPPITKTIDPFILGEFVKDVVLVVKPKHTLKKSIDWAIHEFEASRMRITGIVVNSCNISQTPYKNMYDYGYGYEPSGNSKEK